MHFTVLQLILSYELDLTVFHFIEYNSKNLCQFDMNELFYLVTEVVDCAL